MSKKYEAIAEVWCVDEGKWRYKQARLPSIALQERREEPALLVVYAYLNVLCRCRVGLLSSNIALQNPREAWAEETFHQSDAASCNGLAPNAALQTEDDMQWITVLVKGS